jgi:hypothetical protein
MGVIDGCCVCEKTTNTALGFQGERKFIEQCLSDLGTPMERAHHMAAEHDASNHRALVVLVCPRCAQLAGTPEPVRLTGSLNTDIPVLSQE